MGFACPLRTPAGFVYPLGVPCFSITQALFHACYARGVSLSELCSRFKAKIPFRIFAAPLQFSFPELIHVLPENPDFPRNRCFEALILETSSALKRRLLSFH